MGGLSAVQTSFSIARDLNLVTIYAAFVATIVFLWQVAVYLREGARLRVRANPHMKTIGGGHGVSRDLRRRECRECRDGGHDRHQRRAAQDLVSHA